MESEQHNNFQIGFLQKPEPKIYIILALVSWLYIWLRAIYTPFMTDEIATFYIYIQTERFLPHNMYWDACNHFLNSFFGIISRRIFGESPLALRLPNVLISVFYFVYVYKISLLIKNKFNKWAFVGAMLFTGFITEFMGYCRGYGMAMSFMVPSIYYIIRFLNTPCYKWAWRGVLFMTLAIAASLTMANTFMLYHALLIGLTIFFFIYNKKLSKNDFWKIFFLELFVSLPVFILSTWLSFELLKRGNLYYGTKDGTFYVTLETISRCLFNSNTHLYAYIALSVICILLVDSVYILIRKFTKISTYYLIGPYFLFGNIIGTYLLAKVFGVNYPEDRVAMYFYIFFVISITFICDMEVFRQNNLKYILFIPLIMAVSHSIYRLNYRFNSNVYGYHMTSKYFDFYEKILKSAEFSPTIETYKGNLPEWLFEFKQRNIYNRNRCFSFGFNESICDYVIAREDQFPNWKTDYKLLMHDKLSSYMFLEKMVKNKKQLIWEGSIDNIVETNDLYYTLYNNKHICQYSTITKGWLFELEFDVTTNSIPFEMALIAMVSDTTTQNSNSVAFEFQEYKTSWSEPYNIKQTLLVNNLSNANDIGLFLMNKRLVDFKINSFKTKCYIILK